MFNLAHSAFHLHVGLGIGRVVPAGKPVFNDFVEPKFTVFSRGAGQPELQIFVGFNARFVKK